MTKVLVLYHSMYGHVDTLAKAVAEGVEEIDGVEVHVKRVPETMDPEAYAKAGGQEFDTPKPRPRSWATMMRSSSAPRPASAT